MVDTGAEAASTATVTSGKALKLSSHAAFPSASGGSPVAGGGHSFSGGQQRFDEDVNLPLIKVVVLGAPGVGKTSVVKVCFDFRILTTCFCFKLHNRTKFCTTATTKTNA